jgi:hypothetical protein
VDAGNKWWDGSGFNTLNASSSTAWFNAVTSNSWVNWYSTFTFPTDTQYRVEAQAFDAAGNVSINNSSSTFIMDQNVPQSTVLFPTNNSYLRDITPGVNPISGSFNDTGTSRVGNVTAVQMGIQQLGTTGGNQWKWWNGSNSFNQSGPFGDNTTMSAAPSGNWTYTSISTANLVSGTSYFVTVQAIDNATPVNSEGYFSVRSATFTYDATAPTVVLQRPSNGSFFTNTTLLTISGTAADAVSGVLTVQVNINDGSGNYWSGSDNNTGSFTVGVTTYGTANLSLYPSTWQFRIPAGQITAGFISGHTYNFQARAWDVAGTTSAFTTNVTAIYDIGTPTAAVTFPQNYMNSAQTTISGTAYDTPAGISLVEVAISSASNGANGSWYNGTTFTSDLGTAGTYRSTSSFTLNGAGGGVDVWTSTRPTLQQGKTYLILLRITDNAGNIKTQTIGEGSTFVYDQNGPNTTISSPNVEFVNSLPTLSGGSTDDSSVSNVEVAISTGVAAPYTDYFWNGGGWNGVIAKPEFIDDAASKHMRVSH